MAFSTDVLCESDANGPLGQPHPTIVPDLTKDIYLSKEKARQKDICSDLEKGAIRRQTGKFSPTQHIPWPGNTPVWQGKHQRWVGSIQWSQLCDITGSCDPEFQLTKHKVIIIWFLVFVAPGNPLFPSPPIYCHWTTAAEDIPYSKQFWDYLNYQTIYQSQSNVKGFNEYKNIV